MLKGSKDLKLSEMNKEDWIRMSRSSKDASGKSRLAKVDIFSDSG